MHICLTWIQFASVDSLFICFDFGVSLGDLLFPEPIDFVIIYFISVPSYFYMWDFNLIEFIGLEAGVISFDIYKIWFDTVLS